MSSTDPTKVDSSILSETMRKTSLRPSHFRQMLNTKSSLLTKQITRATMFNSSLRAFIEEFAGNCRFIFTCNYKNKIIEPLHSRCAVIDFTIKGKEKTKLAGSFFKRLQNILDKEGVDMIRKSLRN
jgi:DNA polymerase III delta prime subunit